MSEQYVMTDAAERPIMETCDFDDLMTRLEEMTEDERTAATVTAYVTMEEDGAEREFLGRACAAVVLEECGACF